MQRLCSRCFSMCSVLRQKSQPGFVNTFKATIEKAQEKSFNIVRPFGLPKPVLLNHKLSDTYSMRNIFQELFGEKAKERRQKQLDYDLKHSPIFELKSFRNTNGKIFTPPISYFKADKSLYFPDFIAKTLTGDLRSFYEALGEKVSIVRLFSTVAGEKCTDTYFEVDGKKLYSKDYDMFVKEHPKAQIIDVNMPQGWAKGFILNLVAGNIRKTLNFNESRYANYFMLPSHMMSGEIREQLHCDNQTTGYIYLIDTMGRIRWATSGYANPTELALMWKVVKGLEKEIGTQ
ncbi:Mitochondrial ATPase complex subunit ATP10 [Candida viswanathii]|uniref:Mitochondrial ATPase complex subunit ATP10 n=1 Tax=Candida viswanathii TaxID=5486 RepID=A0A367YB23_9ASCO|nr:Mitochondrial ATPase complex subunit ATP10 [Candida viswanathii]